MEIGERRIAGRGEMEDETGERRIAGRGKMADETGETRITGRGKMVDQTEERHIVGRGKWRTRLGKCVSVLQVFSMSEEMTALIVNRLTPPG